MLYGLSTTAIGHQNLSSALNIYQTLKDRLNLHYLELAIGTLNPINPADCFYPEPLVLHDSCLVDENGKKLRISIESTKNWEFYKKFVENYKVLQMHIHSPNQSIPKNVIYENLNKISDFLGIPVLLEVMPESKYHLSSVESVNELNFVPIVLDVSHVNIWANGEAFLTQKYAEAVLPSTRCIHLSHNDGIHDLHDLIPKDHWCWNWLKTINSTENLLVTYESLPIQFAQYERKDKSRLYFLRKFSKKK